ncbi:unnamed protein product [Kuraishia capsulata CBS 1993]|uniref:Major facilitator superfamily (MFS) profile domain-containing protein n=1 Tax=Kuraishia capsulata CBS 1993 TaxID=1382522 RepID=W6MGB3_9ASCO|nr:uncharacterized protein KUCA_T00000466001 [Kuraishia capsulata CBS 1993]CDK24503.1 unnamed protein product [Kuraishia capsulata CBS 1993]
MSGRDVDPTYTPGSASLSSSVEAIEDPGVSTPQALESHKYTGSRRSSSLHSGQRMSSSASGRFGLERILTGVSQRSGTSVVSGDSMASRGLSVKDIYGDMDNDDIQLQRTRTVNTILTTLSHRASEREKTAQRVMESNTPSDVETSAHDSDEEAPEAKSFEYPEQVPENVMAVKGYGAEFSNVDPELVTWDGPDDPAFPRNWSRPRKWISTLIVSVYTFVSPVSSSMLSPGMSAIAKDFNITNPALQSLVVSIFILAWAITPLALAPFSEMFGRKLVLTVSIICLFAFNLGCSFSQNTAQMIILRFFAGCSGAAPLSIGAGVLGDLWDDKERNFAMAFYSIGPTFGPVFGPVVAGFIVENCGWRWIFWVLCILNGSVAITGLLFYQETYSPTLLRDKAKKLRKATGNPNLKTIYDIADGSTTTEKILVNVARPVKLLCTNPVIIGLGAFQAFVYGMMYLMITTFPKVWGTVYGFNKGISGLMYMSMGVGFAIGIVVWTWAVSYFYVKLKAKNGGVAEPEFRLPTLIFAGLGCPIGLFWYGWSAQHHIHWIMPAIGAAIFAFHLIVVFQAIQNYLIDMNPRFAASSAAAAATYRSCFGFAFPLFASYMFNALGYGWGNTLFAFIGLGLGIPFPLFMLKYGQKLRKWANARMDLEQARRDQVYLARLQAQNVKEGETHVKS